MKNKYKTMLLLKKPVSDSEILRNSVVYEVDAKTPYEALYDRCRSEISIQKWIRNYNIVWRTLHE